MRHVRRHFSFTRVALAVVAVVAAATLSLQRIVISELPHGDTHTSWRVRFAWQPLGSVHHPRREGAWDCRLTTYAPQNLWGLLGTVTESSVIIVEDR